LGDAVDAGDPLLGLGGSAYLQTVAGLKTGTPPRCDLEQARVLHTTLIGLIQCGLVKSAHDCSDGGLAVALAESCISQLVGRETPRIIGAQIDLTVWQKAPEAATAGAPETTDGGSVSPAPALPATTRLDALLFGETQSRVVITTKAVDAVKAIERAKLLGVPAARIGTVGGEKMQAKTFAGDFSWDLHELHDLWWNSIKRAMN
jgi:phosphoribosylformylglycinamidine synthase